MSYDGSKVAFLSYSNNLIQLGDANYIYDAYARDRGTNSNKLVSITDSTQPVAGGTNSSRFPQITNDGRYVMFLSSASNLVLNDPNNMDDVFVRDLKTGATILVSVGRDGLAGGGRAATITPDGHYVVFVSDSELAVTDANGPYVPDVFVRDMRSSVTTLISMNRTGTASGNGGVRSGSLPRITPDGRFVVFESRASDLVDGDSNGAVEDVFVRDLQSGVTHLVSANSSGTGSGNNTTSGITVSDVIPVISADGRYVAFVSNATNLVTNDTNNREDVYVRDLVAETTTLVSVNSTGTSSRIGRSFHPIMSADGRFVVFESDAPDLVANDTNGEYTKDVFVRDLQTGTTSLVSADITGNGSGNGASFDSSMTPDGRYVTFGSVANNLVAEDVGDTREYFGRDVFVRDLQTGTTALVSVNKSGGSSGNSSSFNSHITPNGRFVAFVSFANNLVVTPTSTDVQNVYIRDLRAMTTTLVSINRNLDGGGNAGSGNQFVLFSPAVVTPNGRSIVFASVASNLVSNDANGTIDDVFLFRNMPTVFGVTMLPVADTYVQGATAFRETNYGAASEMQIKRTFNPGTGRGRRGFLRFDTASVTGDIQSARLRVFARLSDAGLPPTNMIVQKVTDTAWDETVVTWNNQPMTASPNPLALITVTSSTGQYYDFDLTDFIRAERAAGQSVVSLRLINQSPTGNSGAFYTVVNSKEAASNQPQLVIEQ
jgi:Tol biopolymer transport system component